MPYISILFGTETGNAEYAAKELESALHHAGYLATVTDMSAVPHDALPQEKLVLVVTSTYGKGDPPANAEKLLRHLETHPNLAGVQYGVCALGDSTYQNFAQCGRDFDRVLGECGAKRVIELCVCDIDIDETFPTFKKRVLAWLEQNGADFRGTMPKPVKKQGFFARLFGWLGRPANTPALASAGASSTSTGPKIAWAAVERRRRLNGAGSAKETIHYELSLEDTGIDYEPGDCIAVHPANAPEDVARFLSLTGLEGSTPIVVDGREVPLAEVLVEKDFQRITSEFAELLASGRGPLAEAGVDVKAYRHKRHVLEALQEHPGLTTLDPQHVAESLLPIPPRLYSIASSQRVVPRGVHLTVETPRYTHDGFTRVGLASGYLCDRVKDGERVRIHKVTGGHFRLPAPDVDVILVGPGTGVAPYRAFLQEREATGAQGRSWLFFGHQHESCDFLYGDELLAFRERGVLTRLDCAWSRDQEEKRYVQHLMESCGAEVWSWLQGGAVLYVCGDKQHMAADVHAALVRIVAQHGNLSPEAAEAWVKDLEENERYRLDVY